MVFSLYFMEKKGKKRKEKMTESEERIVKRLCHAIYYLFKKLKRFFLCVCFLSSAATNGEDGHGLKLEKDESAKIIKTKLSAHTLIKFVWQLHNYRGAFCVWVKELFAWQSPFIDQCKLIKHKLLINEQHCCLTWKFFWILHWSFEECWAYHPNHVETFWGKFWSHPCTRNKCRTNDL